MQKPHTHSHHLILTSLLFMSILLVAGCNTIKSSSGKGTTIDISEDAITADNVATLEIVQSFSASDQAVVQGDFAPTSDQIAVYTQDQIVQIWDMNTEAMTNHLFEHRDTGFALAYTPDGEHLLSGGMAGGQDIKIWDLDTDEVLAIMNTTGWQIFDASWAPDGERFAIVSRGSSRVFFYRADGQRITQRKPSEIWLWSVDYGDEYIATSNEIGVTYLYDVEIFNQRWRMVKDHRTASYDLEFSHDYALLANCFGDGKVIIWEVDTREEIANIDAHTNEQFINFGCRDGEFSINDDVYFSGGMDSTLNAWDPYTGEALYSIVFEEDLGMVTVSDNGEFVAVGLADGTVHILAIP